MSNANSTSAANGILVGTMVIWLCIFLMIVFEGTGSTERTDQIDQETEMKQLREEMRQLKSETKEQIHQLNLRLIREEYSH